MSASDETGPSTRKKQMTTVSRTVRFGSANGLHARPAKMLSQAAKAAGSPISIAKNGGEPVNASSILSLISLGVAQGDELTLSAEAADAEQVLDRLAEILTTDHDAEA